ncbi:MAG: methionine--tRNA ligase, partial [Nanoarchaeota archaeon]
MKKKSPPVENGAERIIVTAALPYANGDIHIGHLLEYIQADIYARFLKLQGKECLYICASDMHGTPIEINAQKAGMPPEKFVDKYWKEHQVDFKSFLIHFDHYYKTHSPENKELAEYFYAELKKKKLIYRKKIQAIYCERCARYLPDRFVKGICPKCNAEDQYGDVCEKCSTILKGADLVNPYCVICKNKPVTRPSEHYFFSLSSFSKQLQQWINSPEAHVQPEMKHWLQEWLINGLEDWCVSRDAPYFGFEIPESKKETGETKYFYVWLDAPIGYISSTKNYTDKQNYPDKHKQKWEDYWYKGQVQHFIGKDIAYFHFLFWPAMLMAVGIPLPKLTVHGFITVDGQKMSKSRGTFFTAKDFLKLYPAEALRFYYANHLDRKVVDVDLNFEDFKAFNNNVLVGSLGNFCYRVITFTQKNYGEVTAIAAEVELSVKVKTLIEAVGKQYAAQD